MERIRDYAVIGDCRSLALISKTGALDWLCWPRFDSLPVFANLLDPSQGQWSVTPLGPYQSSRRYIHHTVVLETTFTSAQGQAVLTDVMPVASEEKKQRLLLAEREIIRQLHCVEGTMTFKFSCSLCRQTPFFRLKDHLGIRANINGGVLILSSSIPLSFRENIIEDTFTIRRGETVYFSLSFSTEAPAVLAVFGPAATKAIDRSIYYWERLSSAITYQGPYQEAVIRSALVLKLMNYAPSGAIIAAPTTSLPEHIGGSLNWDYRYCWLRDASLTVQALLNVGFKEEAQSFVSWLLHTTNLTRPRLKVLYDVYGRKPPQERVEQQFSGYMNSPPVRIGNLAYHQEQLDVYGEVLCGASSVLWAEDEIDRDTQRMLRQLGTYICAHWQEEDAGMWEVRGRKEHFTHSALLCWAGLQALLKLYAKGLLKKLDVEKIRTAIHTIAHAINALAWNDELQTFTSTLRGEDVDANLLLMSWYKFPASARRLAQTHQTIRRHLAAKNGLLFRNRDMQEGVFILCGLWEVAHLAQGQGPLTEAQDLFEHILGYANEVGLLSEELDPLTGELLGNFPLAFTHAGIINAAVAIEQRRKYQELVSAGRKSI